MADTLEWCLRDLPPLLFVTTKFVRKDLPKVIRESSDMLLSDVTVTFLAARDTRKFDAEEFIIELLLHRSRNSQSCYKGFQSLKKVKKCVTRWKSLNIAKILESVLDDLKTIVQAITRDHIFIQSAACLRFTLQRMMGGSALLAKCITYCLETFVHEFQEVLHGFLVYKRMLSMAAVSRTRVLCLDMIAKLTSCYRSIHQLMGLLYGPQTLDGLPDDLDVWLKEAGFTMSYLSDKEKRGQSLDNLLAQYTNPSGQDFLTIMDSFDYEGEIPVNLENSASGTSTKKKEKSSENLLQKLFSAGESLDDSNTQNISSHSQGQTEQLHSNLDIGEIIKRVDSADKTPKILKTKRKHEKNLDVLQTTSEQRLISDDEIPTKKSKMKNKNSQQKDKSKLSQVAKGDTAGEKKTSKRKRKQKNKNAGKISQNDDSPGEIGNILNIVGDIHVHFEANITSKELLKSFPGKLSHNKNHLLYNGRTLQLPSKLLQGLSESCEKSARKINTANEQTSVKKATRKISNILVNFMSRKK